MRSSAFVYAVKMTTNRLTGSIGIHSCWWAKADAERIVNVHNGVNGDYWVEKVQAVMAYPDYWWLRGQALIEGSNGYIPVYRLEATK